MTPREAVERLRADPSDREAWEVVDELLRVLAHRETADPGLAEGGITAVRRSLEDKLLDGALDSIDSPAAYLARAMRWRVRDLVRRRDRERAAAERIRATPPPPPAEDPIPTEVLDTLELVADRAVSRRDPWQRDHLRRAWRQIRALQLEGRSLRALVAEDDGVDPADEPAMQRALQRAHKAHQRTRAALGEALDDLTARGRIDPESAARVRHVLGRLKRRQDRAPSGVSTEGVPSR